MCPPRVLVPVTGVLVSCHVIAEFVGDDELGGASGVAHVVVQHAGVAPG